MIEVALTQKHIKKLQAGHPVDVENILGHTCRIYIKAPDFKEQLQQMKRKVYQLKYRLRQAKKK